MLCIMMLVALGVSSLGTRFATQRQTQRARSLAWKAETFRRTVAGIETSGDGYELSLKVPANRGASSKGKPAVGATATFTQPKGGDAATLDGVAVGVAMISAIAGSDFTGITSDATDEEATFKVRTSLRIDPTSPPTNKVTYFLIADSLGFFDGVKIEAIDNQGITARIVNTRTLWDGRLLVATVVDVLPSDVNVLRLSIEKAADSSAADAP